MKRIAWRLFIILPLITSLMLMQPYPAWAETLVVNPGGGGYLTIQDAIEHAAAAGVEKPVIHIKSGTYTETLDLSKMGSAAQAGPDDLTLVAVDGPGTAILVGGLTDNGAFGKALTIDGLKFQNSPGDAIHLSSFTNLMVVNSSFTQAGTGAGHNAIDLSAASGTGFITIYNSTFADSADQAVLIALNNAASYTITAAANTFHDTFAGANKPTTGLALSAAGSSQSRITIQGSSITGLKGGGPAIDLNLSGSASFYGSIHGNSISNHKADTSLGQHTAAIRLNSNATGQTTLDVTNNAIGIIRNGAGVLVKPSGGAQVNARMQGNTLLNVGINAAGGFASDRGIEVSSSPDFTGLVNLGIYTNTLELIDSSAIYLAPANNGTFNASVLGNRVEIANRINQPSEAGVWAKANGTSQLNLDLYANQVTDAEQFAYALNEDAGAAFQIEGPYTAGNTVSADLQLNNLAVPNTWQIAAGIGFTAPGSVAAPAANRPPNAVDDTQTAVALTATTVPVQDNDSDADGDARFITTFTAPSIQGGTVSLAAPALTYKSPTNYIANDTLYYVVSDGNATDVAKVAITVQPYPSPDLIISKTHANDFYSGQVGAIYTAVVSNIGDRPTTAGNQVTVVDSLPISLTLTSMTGVGWTCGSGTCTRTDSLASGQSYPPIIITVNVHPDAPPLLVNTASVSYDGEYNNTNNFASDTTVVLKPDLTIDKSHNPAITWRQGGTGVYTLRVTNLGTVASAGQMRVTDSLPTGLSYVSASAAGWTCSAVGQSVTCTSNAGTSVAQNAFVDITLNVKIAANAPATVTNSASVSGGGQINQNNDVDQDITAIYQVADLTVTKSDGGLNFSQGQTNALYTLTVGNSGPNATDASITVSDTLPTGLSYAGVVENGWSCGAAGQLVTCTRANAIAAGGSAVLTLQVNVAKTAVPGTVTNTAQVSGGGQANTSNDRGSDTTTITGSPDLTISKSDDGLSFQQGGSGQYKLSVGNPGGGASSGAVTVADTLPAGLTYAGFSGTNWTCAGSSGQNVSCSYSQPIPNGGTAALLTITVNVARNATMPDGPQLVSNTASVSGGSDIDSSNNTGSDTTPIVLMPDLIIAKTHTENFRRGQQNAQFNLSVTNSGYATASGTVTVNDTLPTGLSFVSGVGTDWSCSAAGQLVTCTNSNAAGLAPSASLPAIILTVRVADDAPNTVSNTAQVSGGGQIYTSNDSATDIVTIGDPAMLSITKSDNGPFYQGQSSGAQYSLLVANAPGAGATVGTLTISDTLPAGLTAGAITPPSGWSCSAVAQLVTCTSNTGTILAGGSSVQVNIPVSVAYNAGASLSNTAQVSGGGELPAQLGNNRSQISTTVDPRPELIITKSYSGSFRQGQSGAQYTLTVTNRGGAATSGTVSVVDTLPAGLTATAMSGTGWSCSLATLTCDRSDALLAGASYPAITLTVDVSSTALTPLINQASVQNPGGNEVITTNNTASVSTVIIQVADLTLAKTHSDPFYQGQSGAQYLLTVTNIGSGPSDANIIVQDTLPAGLTYTGFSGAGWTCTTPPAASVTCTRTTALAKNAASSVTLLVSVSKDAAASFTNSAVVSGGGEAITSNNSADDLTNVTQRAELAIDKTHSGDFYQGQTGAQYTIVVTNNGHAATSAPLTVQDTLPAGLTITGVTVDTNFWGCTVNALTNSFSCTTQPAAPALDVSASSPAITLVVDVSSTAAALVTNTATVSGGGDSDTTNNSDSDPTSISGRFDLMITKTHSGSFRQGETGQYSLSVKNAGGAEMSGGTVNVQDILPAGLTATNISGTGWTCSLASLSCSRSDSLPAGASYPAITIDVNVDLNAAPVLTNLATAGYAPAGTELYTGNNSATDVVFTVLMPDLVVDKYHSGNFSQGQVGAQYFLNVSNNGSSTTTGQVVVTDTLPAGLTATAISGTGWSCEALPKLRCVRSTPLAAGTSYPILTVTVNVAQNAAATVINSAIVSGGGEIYKANNTDSDPTLIVLAPDLSITKSHTGSFTQGQSNAQYVIRVTNLGPGATFNQVNVQDSLPVGLTAVSISGTGWTCSLSPLGCTRPGAGADALLPGNSYPDIVLTVQVDTNAPASLTNSASVSVANEINTGNNTASDPTAVTLRANLRLAKVVSPAQAVPGQPVIYTLSVVNQGMAIASNVVLTDIIPAAFQVSGVTFEGVQFTNTGQVPGYVWKLEDLSQGRTGTVYISGAFPTGTLPQVITNKAVVTSSTLEADPANNTAQATLTLTKANSQTSLIFAPAAPIAGQTVIFTATVQTAAPAIGLPTGTVTFTHGTTFLGAMTLDASGQAVLPVNGLAPGSYSITASYGGDPVHNPSSATVSSVIRPQSNLSLGLTVDPNSSLSGRDVTYTISAINAGPAEAANVIVTLQLPTGFNYVPGGSSAACLLQGGQVVCSANKLAVGATLSFSVIANISNQSGSGLSFATANIVSDSADLDPHNNTAQASVNVIGLLNSYFNNFEQPVGPEWCVNRRDVTPRGGRTFLGQLAAETACLRLDGLSAHGSVRVEYDLYLIKTWNGNFKYNLLGQPVEPEAPADESGPDRFMFLADNQVLLDTTFAVWPGHTQAFPAWFKRGDFPRFTGAAENRSLGYYFGDKPADAVYHLTFVFPHTAGSLNLDFTGLGLQSVENESWGLDNVSVTLFGHAYQLYIPMIGR